MQSVCTLLPDEYTQRILDARASICEDPVLAAIYDPATAHFTHQLAANYDWEALEAALADFAKQWRPFEIRTTGLLVFTNGPSPTITAGVLNNSRMAEFHAAVFELVSKFATDPIAESGEPDLWRPHVTIKRCDADSERLGRAMAKLAHKNFKWTTVCDNITVQYDPIGDSKQHVIRLRFPLGT